MKYLFALTVACLLVTSSSPAEETPTVNQRWLAAVKHKVTSGDTRISTPLPERLALLKTWATENGYSLEITKFADNFRVNVVKPIAKQ